MPVYWMQTGMVCPVSDPHLTNMFSRQPTSGIHSQVLSQCFFMNITIPRADPSFSFPSSPLFIPHPHGVTEPLRAWWTSSSAYVADYEPPQGVMTAAGWDDFQRLCAVVGNRYCQGGHPGDIRCQGYCPTHPPHPILFTKPMSDSSWYFS